MRRKAQVLFVTVMWALCMLVPRASGQTARVLRIPDGTPISIHSQYDISTRTVRTGDTVLFMTCHALLVDGTVIVDEGAPVRAVAILAEGAGFGHRGQLVVTIDAVQAVDGSWIPLRTWQTARPSEQLVLSRQDEKLARSHFPNGRDMDYPTNLRLTVYVDQTQNYALRVSADGVPHITPLTATPRLHHDQTAVKLAGGTPVVVEPTHTLSSDGERTGKSVNYVVCEPVVVNGYTVIPKGASAVGTVLLARHSSLLGARGELAVSIDRVQAADGSVISVSFAQHRFGGGSVASVMPPGLPAVASVATAFLPGSSAKMSKHRRFVAYVHDDRWFSAPIGVEKSRATLAAVPPENLHFYVHERDPVTTAASPDDFLGLRTSGTATVASEAEALGASFQTSSPAIYAQWKLKPSAHAREFDLAWLHDGRPYATQRAITVGAHREHGRSALTRPADGFPEGRWTVVLLSDGTVLGTQNFDVTH